MVNVGMKYFSFQTKCVKKKCVHQEAGKMATQVIWKLGSMIFLRWKSEGIYW